MWTLYVFLVVSAIVMLSTHILSITGVLSTTISNQVDDILGYAWVLTGLIGIILIYSTESNQSNTSNDQVHVQEDPTVNQLNVTGTARMTDSSFTMDLHLSETNQLVTSSQDTKTGIQQQLSKDV